MRLEQERAFDAESPVGRYWLRNCVGFHVDGLRGGAGVVEEIGLGPDGVDVLAVRRLNVLIPGTVLVPTHRVESVHPWEDTIVLAPQRRHARERRAEHAHDIARRLKPVARRLKPVGRTAAVEGGRAIRDGAIVVMRLLVAFGTLVWGLVVLARERTPTARRHISNAATTVMLIARAYGQEAKRSWRAQKEALRAWQESRRERTEDPADDGPLTRAGDDEDRRRPPTRGSTSPLDRATAGDQADDDHYQRDHEQQPQEVRDENPSADREENKQHDQYQQQW